MKVQTFFPLVSQRVRSGQWYGKGLLGLVTGSEEQLLEGLLISSHLRLPSTLSPTLGRSTAEWFRAPEHLVC